MIGAPWTYVSITLENTKELVLMINNKVDVSVAQKLADQVNKTNSPEEMRSIVVVGRRNGKNERTLTYWLGNAIASISGVRNLREQHKQPNRGPQSRHKYGVRK